MQKASFGPFAFYLYYPGGPKNMVTFSGSTLSSIGLDTAMVQCESLQ